MSVIATSSCKMCTLEFSYVKKGHPQRFCPSCKADPSKMWPTYYKQCGLCKEEIHSSNFSKGSGPDGLFTKCKPCAYKWERENRKYTPEQRESHRQRGRKYNAEHPEVRRKSHLKIYHGITLEEYKDAFEAQGGKCKICRRPAEEFKKGLAWDHCHTTGAHRGLLCGPCNQGLGLFRDDTGDMRRAILYLQGELND